VTDEGALTVLLVEDDEATADLEQRVLRRGGMAVTRAARVAEALELLARETFTAIVLDYQLPDGNPWQIVEVARTCTPRVPVVLVTAMGSELVAAEAIHRGVAEYVKKSDSFWERLPGIVDRVTRLSRVETARQEAQELLVREQARLEEAQQIARVGSWDWDIAKDLVTWSTELYRIYGLDRDTFKASYQGFLERVHPDDRAGVDAGVRTGLRDRTNFSFVHRVVRPSGDVRVLQSHGRAVLDPVGEPVRMSGTAQDITDQRKLQEALTRQTADLERSNVELERFAYAASHDLRAPLRGISQLAEWIAEDQNNTLSEESRDHLTLLQGRVRRMEALLVDLLEYSRVGREEHVVQEMDVAALIREISDTIQPRSGFPVEVVGALPAITTPAVPLKRVFMNLIDNAVKHHDRAEGVIRVGATIVGEFIRFTVADDGPGIEPQHQARVFELFQTLKPRDRLEGSGMGLTLVRKIVEAVGGEIGVESEGRGTLFWFTWPLQRSVGRRLT